jgi:proteasome lid subunit RPN8/RPN11
MQIDCPPEVLERIPRLLWDNEVERVAVFVGQHEHASARIADVWPAENLHRDPTNNFALTRPQWQDLKQRAAGRGLRIVGIVHSHPADAPAEPSREDMTFARRFWRFPAMALYHSVTGLLVWFNGHGETHRQLLPLPLPFRLVNKLYKL